MTRVAATAAIAAIVCLGCGARAASRPAGTGEPKHDMVGSGPSLATRPALRATAIQSDGAQTCALVDGRVLCWGQLLGGFDVVPTATMLTPLSGLEAFSAKSNDVCGIDEASGGVVCGRWGLLSGVAGKTKRLDGYEDTHRVFVDGSKVCSIDSAGAAWCGYQTGFNYEDAESPKRIALPGAAVSLAGYSLECALLEGGSVWCRDDDDHYRSLQLPTARLMADCGTDVCVVTEDDRVLCRDPDEPGKPHERIPDVELADIAALSSGGGTACAVTRGGGVWCWGERRYGVIGDGPPKEVVTQPRKIPGTEKAVDISCGGAHCCMRDADSVVSCWGRNEYRELGRGEPVKIRKPRRVEGIPPATRVFAGEASTCVAGEPGSTLYCWGRGRGGDFAAADGSPVVFWDGRPKQVKLAPPDDLARNNRMACVRSGVTAHCAGSKEMWRLFPDAGAVARLFGGPNGGTCALTKRGEVLCRAPASFGEIDKPLLDNADKPMVGVRDLALTNDHLCVLAADGTVWCAGSYDVGGAKGEGEHRWSRIPRLSDVRQLDASDGRSCALSGARTIECWGLVEGWEERKPDEIPFARGAVAGFPDDSRVMSFGVGQAHACALDDKGRVFCWGSSSSGQLGDGTRRRLREVGRVGDLTHVVELGVGNFHSCALERSGAVKCWGSDVFGQCGTGAAHSETRPAPVRAAQKRGGAAKKPQN